MKVGQIIDKNDKLTGSWIERIESFKTNQNCVSGWRFQSSAKPENKEGKEPHRKENWKSEISIETESSWLTVDALML